MEQLWRLWLSKSLKKQKRQNEVAWIYETRDSKQQNIQQKTHKHTRDAKTTLAHINGVGEQKWSALRTKGWGVDVTCVWFRGGGWTAMQASQKRGGGDDAKKPHGGHLRGWKIWRGSSSGSQNSKIAVVVVVAPAVGRGSARGGGRAPSAARRTGSAAAARRRRRATPCRSSPHWSGGAWSAATPAASPAATRGCYGADKTATTRPSGRRGAHLRPSPPPRACAALLIAPGWGLLVRGSWYWNTQIWIFFINLNFCWNFFILEKFDN